MNSLISSPHMVIRIYSCGFCRVKLVAFSLVSFFILGSVQADTPLGWINSANMAAYTTTRGEFEFSLAGLIFIALFVFYVHISQVLSQTRSRGKNLQPPQRPIND